MADDFDIWIEERNRIMRDFDVEAGMKMMGCTDRMVAVMGLHKARYECLAISDDLRRESQAWLADNGVKRLAGEAVKRGAPLPT
jgi:hypothetical protein